MSILSFLFSRHLSSDLHCSQSQLIVHDVTDFCFVFQNEILSVVDDEAV